MSESLAWLIILISISICFPILTIGWIVKMVLDCKFKHKYGGIHKHEKE